MTATPLQALARAHNQSINGPRFAVGYCLRETRKLYDVAARYSSATEAWHHTAHRVPLGAAPKGALIWWTGGHDGNGHIALDAGGGYCWSVDIRRSGYFDKVPVSTISREWPALQFAGASLDLNGVQVVPSPPKSTPGLDHAIDDLKTTRDARHKGSRMRDRIVAAIRTVRGIRRDVRR